MNPYNKKVFIIAEAGVNHNGSIKLAMKLVDVAKKSGADAVKFQSFKAAKLATKTAEKAEYQNKAESNCESQYEMLKRLELTLDDCMILKDYCQKKEIEFISSPFDAESVQDLCRIGVETIKIPSGEITNLEYLRAVAKSGKKIILSTGMSTIDEVEKAFNIFLEFKVPKEKITILHANTEYPTPFEDVNITAMIGLGKRFGVSFGYSDHTPGIEVPIAATALGASVIEKHITLDKKMDGPDHKASLEPAELESMVSAIRNTCRIFSDGIKKPSRSESKNIVIARKSIVAATDITKGSILNREMIEFKRPGTGISPMEYEDVLGSTVSRFIKADDVITLKDLELQSSKGR